MLDNKIDGLAEIMGKWTSEELTQTKGPTGHISLTFTETGI